MLTGCLRSPTRSYLNIGLLKSVKCGAHVCCVNSFFFLFFYILSHYTFHIFAPPAMSALVN